MRTRVVASAVFVCIGCGGAGPDDAGMLSMGSPAATTGEDPPPDDTPDPSTPTPPGGDSSSGGEDTGAETSSETSTAGDPPGDDHTHFETECARPGVVTCQSWRVQAEIDEDAHSNQMSIQPGDLNYPQVDAEADGARVPIIDGYGLATLRHEFPLTTGSVWVQYEMRLDAVAFTNAFDGLTMKVWRAEDDGKIGCNDERRLTHNVLLGSESHVYHRDGCEVGEVRMEADGVIDQQPGGDTRCPYPEEGSHPGCFRWQGDAWIRFTYHFDFAGQMLHIWAYRPDDDGALKIVAFPVPGWTSEWGMDVAGVWTHSTSRGHGNWPAVPEYGLYGRNMIVSTEEITR